MERINGFYPALWDGNAFKDGSYIAVGKYLLENVWYIYKIHTWADAPAATSDPKRSQCFILQAPDGKFLAKGKLPGSRNSHVDEIELAGILKVELSSYKAGEASFSVSSHAYSERQGFDCSEPVPSFKYWVKTITLTPFTNGTRVRNPKGDVFMAIDGVLRGIGNMQTYKNLCVVSPEEHIISHKEFPYGEKINDDAQLVTGPDRYHVYLVLDGKKRWITSDHVFNIFGFDRDKVKTITTGELMNIPAGADLKASPPIISNGTLVKDEKGVVYLCIDNKLRGFGSMNTFSELISKAAQPVQVLHSEHEFAENIQEGSQLLSIGPNDDLWLVTDGTLRLITSWKVFQKYNFNRRSVKSIDKNQLPQLPRGADIY